MAEQLGKNKRICQFGLWGVAVAVAVSCVEVIPAQAQSGTSGTDMLLRGLGEFSQSMQETQQCRDQYKGDWNGYYNCSQAMQKRANQRSLQWQMELQESTEKDNQKRQEDYAREICQDRQDDRDWALCMKRYMKDR
jgi:hypothetical protein